MRALSVSCEGWQAREEKQNCSVIYMHAYCNTTIGNQPKGLGKEKLCIVIHELEVPNYNHFSLLPILVLFLSLKYAFTPLSIPSF